METLLIFNHSKDDLEEISRLVRENQSFVALLTGDIYNLPYYLLPSKLSNYTAILDRNVYTRVVGLVRGLEIPAQAINDYRWAAAIMAFCQIAEINFQYDSSLQEYASFKGGDAAVSDYESFRLADNCDPRSLIDFAVGRTNKLNLDSVKQLAPPEDAPTAERLERPIYEFRANYIFALKIALLENEIAPPEQKLIKLLDWMEHEFIFSGSATHFANLLFSPARIKGMLKSRSLQDIRNITWDFALITHWSRCAVQGVESDKPVLLITRDKVVKFIAHRLTASNDEEFRSHFINQWNPNRAKGETVFQRFSELNEKIRRERDKRQLPSDKKLDDMTSDLEMQLGKYHTDRKVI